MSNVRVINIHPQHEVLLGFLFPEYALGEGVAVSRFIARRDVRSIVEREALEAQYDDCIFISSKIFDEVWDEKRIEEEAVRFVRERFQSRLRKFRSTSEDFVTSVLNFLFAKEEETEDEGLMELFEAFGSSRFIDKFMSLTRHYTIGRLITAMNTFLQGVFVSQAVWYKKKRVVYLPKIKANFIKAVDDFNYCSKDGYGLATAKFFRDLGL